MTNLRDMKVAILGPAIEHRDSLKSMLQGRVRQLEWISDSHGFLGGRAPTWRDRVNRALDQLSRTRNPEYLAHLVQQVDALQPDVVIAYWGTNPLPDVAALRRLRPRVKLVLMVLCYPQALTDAGVFRQHWMMRRAAKHLDGLMFPNQEMADYFSSTVLPGKMPTFAVIPPCWPASFQSDVQAAPVSDRANLIFIGRTDLSHHTVHVADDLRPLMRSVVEAGIELHHRQSTETDDGHPLRKPFQPMGQSELIRKVSGHDACLIAYNTAACARDERFRFTVPDRLITTVAAGVPIAIPSEGYEGSKSYLENYPAVIEFESPQALARQLADRPKMAVLRAAAWQARERYCAEAQGPLLQTFLESFG